MTQTKTQNGFTLVELAIALTVIGLLLAGLLKSTEVIENARVSTLISQANHYEAAIRSFRSMYGALPGDIHEPERLSRCTGFCATAGNGDSRIFISNAANFRTADGESHRVWLHLSRAGLINTIDHDYDGGASGAGIDYPEAAFKGSMFHVHFNRVNFSASNPLPNLGHYLVTVTSDGNGMTAQQVRKIDQKMDDGLPVSGRVIGWNRASSGGAISPCGSFADNRYNITDLDMMCDVSIQMNF